MRNSLDSRMPCCNVLDALIEVDKVRRTEISTMKRVAGICTGLVWSQGLIGWSYSLWFPIEKFSFDWVIMVVNQCMSLGKVS